MGLNINQWKPKTTKPDEIYFSEQSRSKSATGNRQNSAKNDYIDVTLPRKKTLIETDTNGYLVLIANDNTKVIMPQYFEYMMAKLDDVPEVG